jgi:hypothetical protein
VNHLRKKSPKLGTASRTVKVIVQYNKINFRFAFALLFCKVEL